MGANPIQEGIVSVRKRGESYAVTVYDPARKGKRWVGTYPSLKAAKEAEAKALLAKRHGGELVATYADRWLELHPRQRRSTMVHYQERIAVFVKAFGARRLADINRVEAREWAIANRSAHSPVRAMFADAIRDGLITENPFAAMRLQQSRGRRDLEVLTVEEVDKAISVAHAKFGPGFAAFIATAAYVGMRPGELYALRWPMIDFAAHEISVVASYSSRSGETTAPKNNQHRRVVLFPPARDALLQVSRVDNTIVFRTVQGAQLTGRTLHYYWDPVRTAIERPGMDFYELRHFCCAHLLNTLGHEAEDVAYQVGHTDGGVLVRKLYGHPSESLARDRLKAGFGRKVTPLRAIPGAAEGQKSA